MRKDGVADVDESVLIAVELGQGEKTVRGLAAAFQQGIVAEQFEAASDGAVAVAIESQQSVVGANPTDRFAERVIVQVELNSGVHADGFDPVAIKVKNQGAAGWDVGETHGGGAGGEYGRPRWAAYEARGIRIKQAPTTWVW